MARNEVTFLVNLRKEENVSSKSYGKYFPEAESREPLSLKGFARHLAEHGKLATYDMLVLVLQNIVSCMKELVAQGQPVKLDGLGTFYPSVSGGETAEMPGFYPEDEYDLAGFAVGVVDKDKILDNTTMEEGDVIIGLPSSGVHSNGFSLVRKVFDVESADLKTPLPELEGKSLGEALLEPTKIYVKPILALLKEVPVSAISHITGGGFYENIPRSIPDGYKAVISKAGIKVLPIFKLLQERGNISEHDMFNTYNMGVGMTVVVAKADANKALKILHDNGEDAYVIGYIAKGEEKIELC